MTEYGSLIPINVITGFKQRGIAPSVYAKGFTSAPSADNHKILDRWSTNMGPLKGHGMRVRDGRDPAVIMHYLLVANDKTGTLWLFIFEAPEKDWAKAWKTGEKMMKALMIEGNI